MELISLVKQKKSKEAIKLVTKETKLLNFLDENECSVLHYASSEGLVEFIVIAAQYGVNIEQRDKDGESSLFKAVRSSKIESIVALVAFKSEVNVVNNKGQSPLDIAVANKYDGIVELLCNFGSSVTIDDWALIDVDLHVLNKSDQRIMQALITQKEREAETENGNNAFEVCYIDPDETVPISTDITVSMHNVSNGFFLYWSRIIPEQVDLSVEFGSDHKIFSDIYDIKTWGNTPRYLQVTIAVQGVVKQNESTIVMPIEGYVDGAFVGHEIQTVEENDNAEEYAKFDIKVDLSRLTTARFAVLSKHRYEEFDVTQDLLKITPKSESGAEITIPAGAFKSQGKLKLNVASTDDWNTEEAVLFTNALDLTMQNNVQPNKPVSMTLPLHLPIQSADDFIIISSHKEFPETKHDWEICSSKIKIERNMATFQAEHFSLYFVGSRRKFRKSAKSASMAVRQYRPAEMYAGLMKESNNKWKLKVGITPKQHGKDKREMMRQEGFRLQTVEFKDCIVKDHEELMISIDGNVQVETVKKSDKLIIFKPSRIKNYRTFYIESDHEEPPVGDVVLRSTKKPVDPLFVAKPEVKSSRFFLLFCNNSVGVEMSKVYMEETKEVLVRLPIDWELPDDIKDVDVAIADSQQHTNDVVNTGDPFDDTNEVVVETEIPHNETKEAVVETEIPHIESTDTDEHQNTQNVSSNTNDPPNDTKDVGVDRNDPQCTIPVLRWSSLYQLSKRLSAEERYQLGVNLNISEKKLSEMKSKSKPSDAVFRLWRLTRPNESLVTKLIQALKSINKTSEADSVQAAFDKNVEYK